jgi:predicted nucleic acid-binding protein
VGQEEQLAFLDDVASGAYTLVPIDAEAVALARDSIRRHAALEPSVADASLVVVADRYGTDRLLTIDERDFRVLVRSDGRPFRLLPADA